MGNEPKWTISTNGGFEPLQMISISDPDTKWCAINDVGSPMEWIVRSHINMKTISTRVDFDNYIRSSYSNSLLDSICMNDYVRRYS